MSNDRGDVLTSINYRIAASHCRVFKVDSPKGPAPLHRLVMQTLGSLAALVRPEVLDEASTTRSTANALAGERGERRMP